MAGVWSVVATVTVTVTGSLARRGAAWWAKRGASARGARGAARTPTTGAHNLNDRWARRALVGSEERVLVT